MKKKLFAALTSAAMLVGSTGTVFADEFVEDSSSEIDEQVVEENGSLPPASVPTNPEDANKVNVKDTFTDPKVREGVVHSLKNELNIEKNVVTKNDLAKIKTLTVEGAKNLNGIELLTGLQNFTATNCSFASADLTALKQLVVISITGDVALTEVNLPNTQTLTTLTINGSDALTNIDLSGNMLLNYVDLRNNALGNLDVTDLPYLATLYVSDNYLNTLDTSKNYQLASLLCVNNGLVSLNLPASLQTLEAEDNNLTHFDGSHLSQIFWLNLKNNALESAKVRKSTNYVYIDLSNNHLATLDLSGVKSQNLLVTNQVLYANVKDLAVNLKKYDEAFLKKNLAKNSAGKYDINGGSIDSEGIFTFKKGASEINYTYDTKGIQEYTTFDGSTLPDTSDSDNGADNDASEVTDENVNSTVNPPATTDPVVNTTPADMDVHIVKADMMNRLYNPNSGEHFYTKDLHEKDVLIELGWRDEGIGWIAPTKGNPVYRLYNPNAGDHHYTKSANEKDTLVKVGWQYEGIGWYSIPEKSLPAAPAYGSVAVYREYNPNAKAAGAHNYTVSVVENDTLISFGWIEEGTAWRALK